MNKKLDNICLVSLVYNIHTIYLTSKRSEHVRHSIICMLFTVQACTNKIRCTHPHISIVVEDAFSDQYNIESKIPSKW